MVSAAQVRSEVAAQLAKGSAMGGEDLTKKFADRRWAAVRDSFRDVKKILSGSPMSRDAKASFVESPSMTPLARESSLPVTVDELSTLSSLPSRWGGGGGGPPAHTTSNDTKKTQERLMEARRERRKTFWYIFIKRVYNT